MRMQGTTSSVFPVSVGSLGFHVQCALLTHDNTHPPSTCASKPPRHTTSMQNLFTCVWVTIRTMRCKLRAHVILIVWLSILGLKCCQLYWTAFCMNISALDNGQVVRIYKYLRLCFWVVLNTWLCQNMISAKHSQWNRYHMPNMLSIALIPIITHLSTYHLLLQTLLRCTVYWPMMPVQKDWGSCILASSWYSIPLVTCYEPRYR